MGQNRPGCFPEPGLIDINFTRCYKSHKNHFTGRRKAWQEKNGKIWARIIDIDILFFNQEIINKPSLKIPHPEIKNRRFALEPMNEIAPQFLHPVLHKTIHQLLKECTDTLYVKKLSM